MPNYDAIRLYHRVEVIYSDGGTHRRLNEVRDPKYPSDPRCRTLARTLRRKSDVMTDTEQKVLAAFPEQGIDLGFYSHGLVFAPAVCNRPVREHAALVSLVRLGWLGIFHGPRDGKLVEILARVR